MKLSEAIRLGAMLKPQGFFNPWSANREPDTMCAIESALAAVGRSYHDVLRRSAFPIFNQRALCPVCGDGDYASEPDVFSLMWHLNDRHRWTREAIADWVATIEPKEQSPELERTSVQDAVDVVGSGVALPVHARL